MHKKGLFKNVFCKALDGTFLIFSFHTVIKVFCLTHTGFSGFIVVGELSGFIFIFLYERLRLWQK